MVPVKSLIFSDIELVSQTHLIQISMIHFKIEDHELDFGHSLTFSCVRHRLKNRFISFTYFFWFSFSVLPLAQSLQNKQSVKDDSYSTNFKLFNVTNNVSGSLYNF